MAPCETVPYEVVRRVDQTARRHVAEALRRVAHGNIYPPERVDAALSATYCRVGNLSALPELAPLWVAGKVDEQLGRYRTEHSIKSA